MSAGLPALNRLKLKVMKQYRFLIPMLLTLVVMGFIPDNYQRIAGTIFLFVWFWTMYKLILIINKI